MYNFGKKIIGIIGIGFLILGSFVLGQEGQEIDLNTNNSNTSRYDNERTNNNQDINNSQFGSETYQVADESENTKMCDVAGAGRNTLGICRCPKGKKEIDKTCVPCSDPGVCCGIELNTKVPFIGDCIEFDKGDVPKDSENEISATQEEAFPKLMGGLMRILVTIIMLGSFVAILAGGVMISSAGSDEQKATKGKKLIIDVVIALAILGASGVILRLINPNFFQ